MSVYFILYFPLAPVDPWTPPASRLCTPYHRPSLVSPSTVLVSSVVCRWSAPVLCVSIPHSARHPLGIIIPSRPPVIPLLFLLSSLLLSPLSSFSPPSLFLPFSSPAFILSPPSQDYSLLLFARQTPHSLYQDSLFRKLAFPVLATVVNSSAFCTASITKSNHQLNTIDHKSTTSASTSSQCVFPLL